MLRFYFFILITALISLNFTDTAWAATVSGIEITGLNVISRGTILSYIPVESGDEIYPSTSNNIVKSLYKTGLFKDISVLEKKGVIKIHLIEKPYIYELNIEGYSDKVIQKEQLLKLLKSIKLAKGEIFNQKILDKFLTQVRLQYKEQGYYLTQVKSDINTDKQGRISIDITIEENDLIRVNTMKISGASVFNEASLLAQFSIGEPDLFFINYFTQKDHYSKVELEAGLEKIQTMYENSGYIDFNIKDVQAVISDDKKSIDVHITIFEGRPYKIGKVRFSGDSLYYSPKDIQDKLTFKTGEIFNQKSLVQSAKDISVFYTEQGYAFVNVSPKISQNSIQKTVDIDISVKLGQRVYINRILIQGNAITQDEVIRREIIQTEGGLYSSDQVKKSVTNLKRLGYFSEVGIQVEKIPNTRNKINLIFNVSETKTGNFSVGLSYSDNSGGFSTNLGLAEKNFLGTGNTLIIDLIQSSSNKKYAFSFINPHFNTEGDSLSYGISYNELDANDLDISNYQISTVSGNLGYGFNLDEKTKFNISLNVASHDIACGRSFINIDAPETIISKQCQDETEIRLITSWSENTLNNFFNPSAGYKIQTSIDFATPAGDFQYIKFDISHQDYTELSDNLVLKLNYKAGVAKGYGDEDLPFFRRYYGGGQDSVRGFKFNSLGDEYSDGRSIGGEVEFAASAAVIIPVPFIKDSQNMRLSAFVDVGSIYRTTSDVNLDDIRISTGVGFNWITVLGPIGLTYAVPLREKSTDETDSFNFNLGSNF